MKSTSRWIVTIIGWIVLLVIFGIWKSLDKQIGTSAIIGGIRGAILGGGIFFLYYWAKNNPQKHIRRGNSAEAGPSFSAAAPVSSVTINPALSNAVSSEVTVGPQPVSLTPAVDGRAAIRIAASQYANFPNTVDEDRVYALIAEELEAGRPEKGLWTRLFAECGGDEKETRVLYIKQRAQRLIAAEQLRLEQAARSAAEMAKIAESKRQQSEAETRRRLLEQGATKPCPYCREDVLATSDYCMRCSKSFSAS